MKQLELKIVRTNTKRKVPQVKFDAKTTADVIELMAQAILNVHRAAEGNDDER